MFSSLIGKKTFNKINWWLAEDFISYWYRLEGQKNDKVVVYGTESDSCSRRQRKADVERGVK